MRPGPDPAAWGVVREFVDATGRRRRADPATVAAVLEVLGADSPTPPDQGAPLLVRAGRRVRLSGVAEVVLEDGTRLPAAGTLPRDLPLGYHRIQDARGERPLIVSPGACPMPPGRTWGWAVQLYALRSAASWGIGDLGDLAELAGWSAEELGAGMIMINPLHAAVPTTPQQPSPYFPSSRRFRNPLYLRVEDIPGANSPAGELEALQRAGRELNRLPRIDRDAVLALKLEALGRLWPRHRAATPPPRGGLRDFAVHCVLAELHGPAWREWPARLRSPRSAAVAAAAVEHADRVAFFAWLQHLLDAQVAAASAPLTVMHDLAVGVDPQGADAWCWQDVLAPGVRVGAPPDEFNLAGQDWGVAAFDPWRLRAAAYQPLIETLRASLSGGAIRIDHVMGLFRLYWIPEGMTPRQGAYVRQCAADLLDIVALECARAGAVAVGEDLGTVEPSMRVALRAANLLSYRLLWFEPRRPERWPRRAMAAVTTHDLPTVAGLWTGADLEAQRSAGLEPNAASTEAILRRLRRWTRLTPAAPAGAAVDAAHRLLGDAPSLVVTATLDDALGVAERPNMPGTIDTWPNWCIPLPLPLEEIRRDPAVRRVAARLSGAARPPRRSRPARARPGSEGS